MSPFVMDGSVWLALREVATGPSQNGTNPFFKAATNSTTQQMIINQFRFAAAKSVRTSTIILATFNAIAAFATAMGILYDNYSRTRRNNRDFTFSRSGFSFVRSGEVYPLVLSFGIVVQSTVFAGAQATGMDTFFITGCTLLSQIMLPAVFLVPYIQLVFGVEVAMRALRQKPFPPRSKWTVTICVTTVGLLVLTNFLVADFIRAKDFCFASLFFLIATYGTGCFGVLTAITAILLVCGITIFLKLHRSTKIEVTERVTSSRMVYYLALATISNTFMLPFFYCLAFPDNSGSDGGQTITLAMVASVVANVSGVMTGGLYLFLKSDTLSTIGPRDKVGEYERQRLKHTIRRYGSRNSDRDGDEEDHVIGRASGPGSLRRMDSEMSLISNEKDQEAGTAPRTSRTSSITLVSQRLNPLRSNGLNPLRSNAIYPPVSIPQPAQMSSASIGHMRKRSYNIFPSVTSSKSPVTLLPATTYAPHSNARAKDAESAADALKPPPSIRNLAGRHRRDSSMVSSATVQIGLRLSSVDDMLPLSNRATAVDTEVITLDCPEGLPKPAAARRPSPLSTTRQVDMEADTIPDASPRRDPVKDARMKTLPPVPYRGTAPVQVEAEEEEEEGEEVVLSPTVYSAEARIISPRGADRAMPTSRFNNGRPSSPATSPPPRKGSGDGSGLPANTKAEWI